MSIPGRLAELLACYGYRYRYRTTLPTEANARPHSPQNIARIAAISAAGYVQRGLVTTDCGQPRQIRGARVITSTSSIYLCHALHCNYQVTFVASVRPQRTLIRSQASSAAVAPQVPLATSLSTLGTSCTRRHPRGTPGTRRMCQMLVCALRVACSS